MILKDFVDEYKFVYDTLLPCEDYFNKADILIKEYFSKISSTTSKYFKIPGPNSSHQQQLVNELSEAISSTYNNITILITMSFEFYGALKILELHDFKNPKLQILVKDFTQSSHAAIDVTNLIIKSQLSGMKKEELLSSLVSPLQGSIKSYHTLLNLYKQFLTVNDMLLEPLPDNIANDQCYEDFCLQSLNPTVDIADISSSLMELSYFFENLGRLCNDTGGKDYYLRKIETGSLLTIFATAVPIIIASVKLIDYCYPKFMQWRQLYFTDKEQQLKLGSEEIKAIKELLEINPDIPNADELLETASVRLFKYFKLNPNFKVNEKEYKTNMDIKLLQKKDSSNE